MGDLIQLRDYQNPKDLERLYSEGMEIVNIALMGDAGIEFADTAPAEYCAPDGDCG